MSSIYDFLDKNNFNIRDDKYEQSVAFFKKSVQETKHLTDKEYVEGFLQSIMNSEDSNASQIKQVLTNSSKEVLASFIQDIINLRKQHLR